MVTHPTFVVGVGQAGINVMSTLEEVAEQNDDADKFGYAAIDTDEDTLRGAPTDAQQFSLAIEDDFLDEDVAEYPYLTSGMNIEGKGARRQRPVGRYKLDNRGEYENTFESLWREIESHFEAHEADLGPQQASFNIYYVHSQGGGTGSGTFPLLTGMLSYIADQLDSPHVYLAGVGVVPEIPFGTRNVGPIPGRPIYYPNANAALHDLEQFERLAGDGTESLQLPVYAKQATTVDSERRTDVKEFAFDQEPFDDYWLVGVDEGQIKGGAGGRTGPETYRQQVNQTVARSLHAVAQLERSAENWAQAKSVVGTVDQAEISVPHEEVLAYCELKADRVAKRERKDEEIPDEIAAKEGRKAEISALKANLNADDIEDADLRRTVQSHVEGQGFTDGKSIIENKSSSDVEAVLEEISEEYAVEGEIVAVSVLQDKLQQERGAPEIEAEWRETVQNLWSKYNMQSQPGGSGVRTIEGKASRTKDYLDENIGEYKEILEEWDPGILGQFQDAIPPVVGIFESERENAESVVERLQDDYDDLERIQGTWNRVSKMRAAVSDHRASIREEIDDQLSDLDAAISDLRAEQDRLEQELEALDRQIESKVDDLTEAETSKRLAVLPVREDELRDLTVEQVEDELTSLHAYVERDLVDENKLRRALSQRVDFCKAWENSVIDRETAGTDVNAFYKDFDETWYLFHQDNREFQEYINRINDADEETMAGEGPIDYLSDPYRIEYVSFSRRGPVPALVLYQQLEEKAEDGTMADLAGQYDDFKQAFAYLEWYDRDVRKAFSITDRVEVPFPPELDHSRVDKPGLSEGELKNYVKTNGLDSYLWEGMMWDLYEPGEERFTGWKRPLSSKGLSWTALQKATPSPDLKSQWLAGQADWADLVDAYAENLVDQTGLELQYPEE